MNFIEMPHTVCSSDQVFQHGLQKRLTFHTASGAYENTVGLNTSLKDERKKTLPLKKKWVSAGTHTYVMYIHTGKVCINIKCKNYIKKERLPDKLIC